MVDTGGDVEDLLAMEEPPWFTGLLIKIRAVEAHIRPTCTFVGASEILPPCGVVMLT